MEKKRIGKMKRLPPISVTLSFLLCRASAFLLLALTFFPRIQQPHTLLTSTHDLITKAKSSSTFIFFTCNLIIISIILTSSKRPPSNEDELHQSMPPPFVGEQWQTGEKLECVDIDSTDSDNSRHEEDIDIDGADDENDEDGSFSDDDNNNCDSEDSVELHKRIEEFIAKTFNEWKQEKLRDMQMLI